MQEKKVMVVDADHDILTTLSNLFKNEGIEVIAVDNGWKCLMELENGFKGVVLMDIMMAQMSGWQIIKNAVKGGFMEDVILIILTAKHTPNKEIDEFDSYIQDYITKPFDIKKIVPTVKKYFP